MMVVSNVAASDRCYSKWEDIVSRAGTQPYSVLISEWIDHKNICEPLLYAEKLAILQIKNNDFVTAKNTVIIALDNSNLPLF